MSLTDYSGPASKFLEDRGSLASAHAVPSETVMAGQIRVGTVFIEEGAPVPDSLVFESAPYSNGWRFVKNLNGYELDRKICQAGWTLFDLAQIKATAFGSDREKAVRRAVNRILTKTKLDNFNALEISQVAVERFLGLPHVVICAHVRHVQESMFLLHDKRLAKQNEVRLVYSRADRGS